MLFRSQVLDQIAHGRLTLAFRRWRRPTVKEGGSLETAVGMLAIEAVDRIREGHITEEEARGARMRDQAGAAERAERLEPGRPVHDSSLEKRHRSEAEPPRTPPGCRACPTRIQRTLGEWA
jgi:replicative superfamily II helicase